MGLVGGGEGVLGEGSGRGEVGKTGRLEYRGRGGRRGAGRSGRWAGVSEADHFRDAARLVSVGLDGIGVVQWGRSCVMAGIHGRTRAIRRWRCEGRRRCDRPGSRLGSPLGSLEVGGAAGRMGREGFRWGWDLAAERAVLQSGQSLATFQIDLATRMVEDGTSSGR